MAEQMAERMVAERMAEQMEERMVAEKMAELGAVAVAAGYMDPDVVVGAVAVAAGYMGPANGVATARAVVLVAAVARCRSTCSGRHRLASCRSCTTDTQTCQVESLDARQVAWQVFHTRSRRLCMCSCRAFVLSHRSCWNACR